MVLLSVARGCHAATSSARATVLRHTVPVALPSLSQRLHLITAACDVYHMTPDELPPELGPGGEPFWGFVWPGSWGLSLHVLASPDVVSGKRVMDFASGCGVSAIAAAHAGTPVSRRLLGVNGACCMLMRSRDTALAACSCCCLRSRVCGGDRD